MSEEIEIKAGMSAHVRGGHFVVVEKSANAGFWDLKWQNQRAMSTIISLSDADTRLAIAEFNADQIANEVSRQESPFKDQARLRFFPKNTR